MIYVFFKTSVSRWSFMQTRRYFLPSVYNTYLFVGTAVLFYIHEQLSTKSYYWMPILNNRLAHLLFILVFSCANTLTPATLYSLSLYCTKNAVAKFPNYEITQRLFYFIIIICFFSIDIWGPCIIETLRWSSSSIISNDYSFFWPFCVLLDNHYQRFLILIQPVFLLMR